MPPKFKFTKAEIADAALQLTREEGISAVTARNVAARLKSSPKVIFSLFENMQELQKELLCAASRCFDTFTLKEIQKGEYPPYKAVGMAYIRFAREEKELFRLLYMRDRSSELSPEADTRLLAHIMQANGVGLEQAKRIHLEMWICVHGIATMLATAYQELDEDLISRILTDTYEGIKQWLIKEVHS